MGTYDELLLESPAFQQPAAFRGVRLNLPETEDGSNALDIKAADLGGAAYLATSADGSQDRFLLWEFTIEDPELLRLSEVSQAHSLSGSAVKVRFPSALHPQALLTATPHGHSLVVLEARGVLHALHFPHAAEIRAEESVLKGFTGHSTRVDGGSSVASVPLKGWAKRISSPISLAEAAGFIAIGAQAGGIVCLPKSAFNNGSPDGAMELQDSKGLLGGFFARPANVPVKDLASIQINDHGLLVAVYGDNVLRVWEPATQKRLFVTSLLPVEVGRALTPQRVRVGPPEAMDTDARLLVQFGPANPEEADVVAPQVAMYKLVAKQGLAGLSLQATSGGLCSLQGFVEDVVPWCDDAWGSGAWILGGDKQPALVTITEDGSEGPAAVLLSSDSANSLHPTIQAGLWQSVQDAVARGQDCSIEVARQLLRKLLIPGEHSPKALSLALEELGKPVSPSDLKGNSVEQILDFLIEVIRQQERDVSVLHSVQRLLTAYRSAWEGLHPAYTLLRHPQSGKVSVMRAGPSLLLLRSATPSEALLQDPIPEEVVALGDVDMGGMAASGRLVLAAGVLTKLLGGTVAAASSAWLWQGRSFAGSVVPALLTALAASDRFEGPAPAAQEAAAAREWRQQRRVAPLQIARLLSNIPNLTEAALELLADIIEPPLLPFSGATLSAEAQAANIAAFRRSAEATVDVLQGLLLLLGYLAEEHFLAGWELPELGELQRDVVPQAEAALRQAAIVSWLASTTMAAAPSADPSSMMTRLHLESPQLTPQEAFKSQGPAQLLARLFSTGQAVQAGPVPASLASLSTGPQGEQTHLDALLDQVLGTSLVLLTSKQYVALTELLSLAAPLSDFPAVKLLQGYAALGRLKQGSGAAARAQGVQEALQPLFQAAAALGPRLQYLTSQREAENKRWLQQILHHLQREWTGSTTVEPLEAEQLQCFEVLMQLCDQLGCLEGAARFAQAAAHHAQLLRSGAQGSEHQELLAREGRIWDNLFEYALQAGSYQEAYAALDANPVPERRLHCLRRLINTLCQAGVLPMLAGLPFASTVEVQADGGLQTVPLLQEAIRILQQRAENAQLKAKPQPYQVLADFCAARGDWRSAAAAQLAFARRLQEEGSPSPALSKQISLALGAAANALSLVEPQHAWLEDQAPAQPAGQAQQSLFGAVPQPSQPLSPSTQADSSHGEPASSSPGVITLEGLVREARAAAAVSTWTLTGVPSKPADVVRELHSTGRYEAAVDLAGAVLEGEPRAAAVRKALAGMAAACALKQVGKPGSRTGMDSFADDGNHWELLQMLVQRHSAVGNAAALWAAVATAILNIDKRLHLPAWLLSLFLAGEKRRGMAGGPGDPVGLLQIYIRHGKLREAGNLALSYLTAWLDEVSDIDRQHPMGAWFPHGLLDTLQDALGEAADPSLHALGASLGRSRGTLAELAAKQTELLMNSLERCSERQQLAVPNHVILSPVQ